MFNLKEFINTYPSQIIIGFLVIILILVIVLIINSHKEMFTPLFIKEIQLESQGKKLTIDGVNKFKLNKYADNRVYFTHNDKILTYKDKKLQWTLLQDDIDSSQIFIVIFFNPYQCRIENAGHGITELTINGLENEDKSIFIPNKYIWQFKNGETIYSYYDLNIKYVSNEIMYIDTELTTINDVQIHKTGGYENAKDWNNDNNTTQLHFWKGAKNHPNSKHILLYNLKNNETTIFRIFNNKIYRFNVYGVRDGCTKLSPLKLYASNKNEPSENEIFIIDWVDSKDCQIKTKCGNGYIGGKTQNTINHNQNVFAGSDVSPAYFRLYSYGINKELYRDDFKIKDVQNKLIIPTTNKTQLPDKIIPIETTEYISIIDIDNEKYKEYDKFNLKYNNKSIDANFNVNSNLEYKKCCSFFKDNEGNIRRVNDNLIVIPKNYIREITKKNVILKSELYGDGRYCKSVGCMSKSSNEKVTHIYLNKKDMPIKKCCRNRNEKYVSIKTLEISNFREGVATAKVISTNKKESSETKQEIPDNSLINTKNEYCNLKYQAYYLSPIKKNGKYYFKCNSAHSNKQDYIIKDNELINAENNDVICKITNIGKTIGTKLYGDGRYWMGQIAKVDDSRVREIYLDPSDMPEKVNKITRKKHTGYVEIGELKKADNVWK